MGPFDDHTDKILDSLEKNSRPWPWLVEETKMEIPEYIKPEHKDIMFFCTCGTEGMVFSTWGDPEDLEVGLSMWESRQGPLSWQYRLNRIWNLLTNKPEDTSDIILNKVDVIRLRDTLNMVIGELDENN